MISLERLAFDWVEQGRVPDALVRQGIRQLCRRRLDYIAAADCEAVAAARQGFVAEMLAGPVAPVPDQANAQHYEVPAAFFAAVLGPRRKYSCCHFPIGVSDLAAAEDSALALTCLRADITDGQDILELGCGWGSLSLWLAEHYPAARITAVSNSHSQRQHIEVRAAERNLTNLRVITADMNDFTTPERFDRVVSVEMFEHMRNWGLLFQRVAGWLKPEGRFFMHVFCHRDRPYAFEDQGEDDWMSRHFFTGGIMPSDDLPLRFQDHLRLIDQWRWSGRHYERTANAWLANLDARKEDLMPVLADCYGADQAGLWFQRWRLFFLAVAETFGFDEGQTWWVSHYLFERREGLQ